YRDGGGAFRGVAEQDPALGGGAGGDSAERQLAGGRFHRPPQVELERDRGYGGLRAIRLDVDLGLMAPGRQALRLRLDDHPPDLPYPGLAAARDRHGRPRGQPRGTGPNGEEVHVLAGAVVDLKGTLPVVPASRHNRRAGGEDADRRPDARPD